MSEKCGTQSAPSYYTSVRCIVATATSTAVPPMLVSHVPRTYVIIITDGSPVETYGNCGNPVVLLERRHSPSEWVIARKVIANIETHTRTGIPARCTLSAARPSAAYKIWFYYSNFVAIFLFSLPTILSKSNVEPAWMGFIRAAVNAMWITFMRWIRTDWFAVGFSEIFK